MVRRELTCVVLQLVCTAMGFLASVAGRNHYKQLFADPALLREICLKVAILAAAVRCTTCGVCGIACLVLCLLTCERDYVYACGR